MNTPRHHFKVGLRGDHALDMVVEVHSFACDGQAPENETRGLAREILSDFKRQHWHWEGEILDITEVAVKHPVVKPRNAFQWGQGELWCPRF